MSIRPVLNARRLVTGAALAILAGCAVGPDFVKPDAPSNAGYTVAPLPQQISSASTEGGVPQRLAEGMDVPFDWWKRFQSPNLDRLVEQALRNNPTISAAQAALRQAQEQTYAQQGMFLPAIGVNYSFERQQLAGNQGGNSPGIQGNGRVISTYQNPSGPAPYNGPVVYNMHNAQLSVGYVPDLLGANRRAVESLDAAAESQRYNLQATYVSLAANVVSAAIQEASLQAQIQATETLIADQARALDIVRREIKAGYAMAIDLAAQEAALAQARAQLPPLIKSREQNRDAIRALAGVLPNEPLDLAFTLESLHLPQDLPVSLPSAIIRQRPDVRAAEEQMRSATAAVGVAIAARLPQFALDGTIGGTASEFYQMFKTGGPFWTMTGSVAQSLFDGNSLLHKERAADQALLQSAALYKFTVLTAYQNVADSLHALLMDADSFRENDDNERASKRILDVTRRQREAGLVNQLTLLAADEAYQQAVIARASAQANRLSDSVALFQALGGGWWNRGDAAMDDTGGDFLLDLRKHL